MLTHLQQKNKQLSVVETGYGELPFEAANVHIVGHRACRVLTLVHPKPLMDSDSIRLDLSGLARLQNERMLTTGDFKCTQP